MGWLAWLEIMQILLVLGGNYSEDFLDFCTFLKHIEYFLSWSSKDLKIILLKIVD